MDEAGNIDLTVMPDLVHSSSKGYQIWVEAIEPELQEYKFGKR